MYALTLTNEELNILQGYEFSPKNRLGVLHMSDGARELIKVRAETIRWWGKPPFGNLDVSLKGVSDYLCSKVLPGPESPAYATIHALAERCLFEKVDGSRRVAQLWQKLGDCKRVKYAYVGREINDHGPHCEQLGSTSSMEVVITPMSTFNHICAQFETLISHPIYYPHVHGPVKDIRARDFVVHLVIYRNKEKSLIDP